MVRSTLTFIAVAITLFTTQQADARVRHETQYKSSHYYSQHYSHKARHRSYKTNTDAGLGSFYQSSPSAPWLQVAQKYVGSGPQALGVRRSLWCAAGLNKFLQQAGYKGTGSDMAKSFAKFGSATTARPGAIAVMSRGRSGGHVGIVVADLGNGKVKILSANYQNKVAYGVYSKSRIYAYRWPSNSGAMYASLN